MINRFSSFLSVCMTVALLLMPASTLNLPAVPSDLSDTVMSLEVASAETESRLAEAFGQLPLYFVENQGQVDDCVAYYIKGRDTTLYFTAEGITFVMTAPLSSTVPLEDEEMFPLHKAQAAGARQRWTVKLDFVGENPEVRPVGEDRTEAVISYFKGPSESWKTGLPTYNRIVYYDLWPGIDLVFYGTADQLKYDFLVHPGADPNQIQIVYRGADSVALNATGQLEVRTPLGGFTDEAPVGYQEINGRRVEVETAYLLESEDDENLPDRRYSFDVEAYDPRYLLVIDPAMILYCGYIGGFGSDYGNAIAVDEAGSAYITGYTSSSETEGFPVTVGPDLTCSRDGFNLFVAKVNAAGTALVYCGYIGGSYGSKGNAIAVDEAGNAYVTGYTSSSETNGFPATVGPDLTFNGGSIDAFVAKVNAAGTALVYCGYIGGSRHDEGVGIAVDEAGNAYVTGMTDSSEAEGFPVTVGPDLTYNNSYYGYDDAFVVKISKKSLSAYLPLILREG